MSLITGNKFVGFAVKTGLTVLIAAGLAQLTWYLLDKYPVVPRPPAATVAPVAPPIAAQKPPAPTPNNRPATPPNKPRRVPTGNEDLVLTGIMRTGNSGAAVMRVNNQPEAAFSIGQQILPGIILHAVMSDRVIIQNDDVLESLTLTGKRTQLTLPVESPDSPATDLISMRADNHYLISRKLIDTNVINPQALLTQSAVTPSPTGGLVVQAIEPGSVYEKLGIRAGDIVVAANGKAVNTVQDAMQAFYELQAHNGVGDIQLKIQRNGKPLSLQYTVE